MKKFTAIIVTLVFSTTLIFAKQQDSKKPTPLLTVKDSLLCKAWKMVSYELFSVVNKPEENQKNDGVTFMLDGTAFLTVDGVQKTGTWTSDKVTKWVTLIFDGGEKYKIQVMELTNNHLLYEYQDKELMRTKFTCEPLKK